MINIGSNYTIARENILGIFDHDLVRAKANNEMLKEIEEEGMYIRTCPDDKLRSFVLVREEELKLYSSSVRSKTLNDRFRGNWGL